MPFKNHEFLIDKSFFKKSVNSNVRDLTIKIDFPNREITSFRLYLRPLKVDDLDEYYKLYSDPAVMEKYCDGNLRSMQEVDTLMSNYLDQTEPSYFSIFQKRTNSFIGTIFLTTRNQKPGEILLGYLIHKNYWGNNYAKEALYSLLYCLFPVARPQITTVLATTRDDNIPSKKILESFNFQCIEEVGKFNQKRLVYKADTQTIKEIHHNLEAHNLILKKNLGATFLTCSDLLDNAGIYKYLIKEIILPILPYDISDQFETLWRLLPQDKLYWISTHLVFDSLGYYFILNNNFPVIMQISLPLVSTVSYSMRLLINEYYHNISQERINSVVTGVIVDEYQGFFDNCFHEITFGTLVAFTSSLPITLSVTSKDFSYTAFSTISSLTSSSLNCAASNKHIIEPINDHLITKILPYIVDSVVALSTIKSVSFSPYNDVPDLLLNFKKAAYVTSSVAIADQLIKSLITLIPDEIYQYYDSLS